MKVTLSDLRRNPGKIVEAIKRGETVTLSKRGKEIAYIIPKHSAKAPMSASISVSSCSAIGMWKDREDMKDPSTRTTGDTGPYSSRS
ncbi:MAG: type II toxin-antitoxin system prevent-host-death family antitoxin [Candidatus Hydrogenedentes bacterium]|nr:type II toxin-antitoxin system prevent-host-death family antitoxin [Candidatus Hydrogenedentota bacterium]